MSKIVDSITGASKAKKASIEAGDIQLKATEKAIDFAKESRDIAREDVSRFKTAGESSLTGLQNLVNNPQAQLSFIQDNPFFKALSNQASQTLFSNAAAKGKIGSGGTAEALQNSLLLLGSDLVNQSINQRQNLAGLGLNAATGSANITQNTSQSVTDLISQGANAKAAGLIGGANAVVQGRQGLLGAGGQIAGALAICDLRLKENIIKVGQLDNGLPLYLFNYKGDDKLHINVMAQDVEKVNPDAVIEINNIKHVNMNKIWQ